MNNRLKFLILFSNLLLICGCASSIVQSVSSTQSNPGWDCPKEHCRIQSLKQKLARIIYQDTSHHDEDLPPVNLAECRLIVMDLDAKICQSINPINDQYPCSGQDNGPSHKTLVESVPVELHAQCYDTMFRPIVLEPIPLLRLKAGTTLTELNGSSNNTVAIYGIFAPGGLYVSVIGPDYLNIKHGYLIGKIPDVAGTDTIRLRASNENGQIFSEINLEIYE